MKAKSATPRSGVREAATCGFSTTNQTRAHYAPRLLSAQEAANYLGYQSTEVLKNIPVKPLHLAEVGVGKAARYDRNALDAWLDELSELTRQSEPPRECDEAQAEFDAWKRKRREARAA